jgi:CHAD domain-containing protein
VLLAEYLAMLKHEAGSRSGEDIEDVHKMRVAIRQMRSLLRLLKPYYKTKWIRPFTNDLRWVMRALGEVRDLDVMIRDLSRFEALDSDQRTALGEVLHYLEQRRDVARASLHHVLDSKAYRRFHRTFSDFLLTAGAGVKRLDVDEVHPAELRHVLPPMIYTHLAAVRAYDSRLAEADATTLHALRIECKRLRYVVTMFSGVLGKEIDGFIEELKALQDYLGRLNDIEVASRSLLELMEDLEPDHNAALRVYVDALEKESPALVAEFPAKWKRFNSKTVQRKLANAVLAL